MSDYIGRVTEEQDFFKKILGKIPGFSGYVDRQNRRTADKLLRDAVADHFENLWQRISSLQRDVISGGEIEKVDDFEAASLKIRQFIDRVRTAAYGYAGFFDAVKINTEELTAIYEYDLRMLTLEDEMSRAIDNVGSSMGTDGLPAAVRHLVTLSQECLNVFDERKEVIVNSLGGGSTMPSVPTTSP